MDTMNIFSELLTPERTLCKIAGKSKKRIFETVADAAYSTPPKIPYREVYEHLLARERLGSTGLGMGIAIPHCRAESCVSPIGVLATLETGLDFNSPDGHPVTLLFALIVPYEAHQEHLDALAEVAKLFSDQNLCDNLREAKTSHQLHDISTNWKSKRPWNSW